MPKAKSKCHYPEIVVYSDELDDLKDEADFVHLLVKKGMVEWDARSFMNAARNWAQNAEFLYIDPRQGLLDLCSEWFTLKKRRHGKNIQGPKTKRQIKVSTSQN